MRVGVVSDTHGHVLMTQQAVRMLESLEVDLVLHCGDIGTDEIVPMFAAWETHFVFGNVDHHQQDELRAAIEAAGQTCHGTFGALEREGLRIAILHSDDERKFRETTAGGEFDLVCYGHTHVARQHHEDETLVLNPGAIYRARPHSIALVELPDVRATIVPL